MNELLQKGYSNYRAVFKADSTCVMTIHDLDKLVQKEIGKYWITKDGKNLISVTKNKAQYSSKIILLTKDTLRITPDLKQILTYVRAK